MAGGPSERAQAGERIADRYRVERWLGRGGMGEVLQVWDDAESKRLALKRLRADASKAGRDQRLQELFEREYDTLARLDHPGIVRVHDYGVGAEGGAYYTMDLLEGDDLHSRAPMPYAEAAPLLREVAAALSLLHSRQLLHRDLNAKNVRIGADGHARLIDFGALTRFGIPRYVVGTPPVIPPEALGDAPLDQRADLFGFGALMYFTLTGKHAFPARSIDRLPLLWAEPIKPLAQLVEVPPELGRLVADLLSLKPQGRPRSAAEVIDRLSDAAGLPAERDSGTARRNLPSPALVGRDAELERLTAALEGAARGARGAALALRGPAGAGKTRLMTELAIEAQLAGMAVVQVRVREHAPGGDLLRRIVSAVYLRAPELAARMLAAHSSELAPFVPGAPDLGSVAGELAGLTRRTTHMAALRRFLLAVAGERPLCLLVDDVQHGSEEEAALVALLAHATSSGPLVCVTALGTPRPNDPEALEALLRFSETIELGSLGVHALEALVRSMFGEVPHTGALASALSRTTGGNPAQCVELLRHLLEQGAIGYLGGTWVLPRTLDDQRLPASAEALAEAQLAQLGPGERAHAEALSLCRGTLGLGLSRRLGGGGAESLAALDALCSAGVLMSLGDGYTFRTELTRAALTRSIAQERRLLLHRQIAEAFLERADSDLEARLEAAHHFIAGDDALRGGGLLATARADVADRETRLHRSIGDMEAALAAFRAQGRSAVECLPLLGPLLIAGMYSDRRLIDRYGDQTLAALLDLTQPDRTPPEQLRKNPLLGALCSCASTLMSAAQAISNSRAADKLLERIAALAALPEATLGRTVYEFCELLVLTTHGDTSRACTGLMQIQDRLLHGGALAGMPEDVRVAFHAGLHNAIGLLLAIEGDARAAQHASALRALGHPRHDTYAEQILYVHHSYRGESAQAARHQRRADLLSLQGAGSWRADIWLPAGLLFAHQLTSDVLALRRLEDHLERLSRELPTLGSLRDGARMAQAVERGRHDEAAAIFEQNLTAFAEGSKTGWTIARANYASALNGLGRHGEAVSLCESALSRFVAPEGALATRFALERQAARAEHGLGHADAAAQRLQRLLELDAFSSNPLLNGSAHLELAELAIRRRDRTLYESHRVVVQRSFAGTENPELMARYERLVADSAALARRTQRGPRR